MTLTDIQGNQITVDPNHVKEYWLHNDEYTKIRTEPDEVTEITYKVQELPAQIVAKAALEGVEL